MAGQVPLGATGWLSPGAPFPVVAGGEWVGGGSLAPWPTTALIREYRITMSAVPGTPAVVKII